MFQIFMRGGDQPFLFAEFCLQIVKRRQIAGRAFGVFFQARQNRFQQQAAVNVIFHNPVLQEQAFGRAAGDFDQCRYHKGKLFAFLRGVFAFRGDLIGQIVQLFLQRILFGRFVLQRLRRFNQFLPQLVQILAGFARACVQRFLLLFLFVELLLDLPQLVVGLSVGAWRAARSKRQSARERKISASFFNDQALPVHSIGLRHMHQLPTRSARHRPVCRHAVR